MDAYTYQCKSCGHGGDSFADIVGHSIDNHSRDEIVVLKRGHGGMTKRRFGIVPDMCRSQGRTISVNNENETLHVSKATTHIPLKKKCKLVNESDEHRPTCTAEVSSLETIDRDNITEISGSEDVSDNSQNDLQDLITSLPDVIDKLKEYGHLEEYMSFHNLLKRGEFPMRNIAYLLFLDVVRWQSLEKSSSFMRYNDEVRLFWQTGLRLFHGKFLRFMSGPKGSGHITEGMGTHGALSPQMSKVNFIVPSRQVLAQENSPLKIEEPGIFSAMIDSISATDQQQTRTFKLCVDGKKINPSSRGEVDLWGYEGDPTREMRRQRMDHETSTIHRLQEKLAHATDCGHADLHDLTEILSHDTSGVAVLKRGITLIYKMFVKVNILRALLHS